MKNSKNLYLKILLVSIIHPDFIRTLLFNSGSEPWLSLTMDFAMTLSHSIALFLLISVHKGLSKWNLMWQVGLIYYGITYFQSSIEAVLFLKYMQNTMTDAQIYEMIYVGIINSVVMAIASVMLFWKEREVQEMYQYPLGTNLKRIILLGFFYALVYVLFGGFVFKPLAGEHFQIYYGELQIPDWLLPFQILRGFLWAALAFWTASIISAGRKTAIWVITGIITIPFSTLLLPINEIMPAPIRMAHLVEVTSSMLVFGYVLGRVFTKPLKRI